jgi:hypothetical protein
LRKLILMTGPQIEFIIRQVNPVDLNVSSVRYDIQTSFVGPFEVYTGPYVYRESKVTMVGSKKLYKNTTINQVIVYSGSFPSNIAVNLQRAARNDLNAFYDRAKTNAQAYFVNTFTENQSIKGYTGPLVFSGSGILNDFYRSE